MIQRLTPYPIWTSSMLPKGKHWSKRCKHLTAPVRAAAAEFLKLRQTRRAAQDKEIAAFEQSVECLKDWHVTLTSRRCD